MLDQVTTEEDAARLLAIALAHPKYGALLTGDGIGVEEGHDFAKCRAELFSQDVLLQIRNAADWLSTRKTIKTIERSCSCYGWKHQAEGDLRRAGRKGNCYISQAAFMVACLGLGIPASRLSDWGTSLYVAVGKSTIPLKDRRFYHLNH